MTQPSNTLRPEVTFRPQGPGPLAPGLRDPRRKFLAEGRAASVFLTPWFIGVVAVIAVPLVISLYLSFTRYNLLTDPQWIGFDNYIRLFTGDPRYVKALTVTLTYVVTASPLKLLAALLIALLLASPRRKGQGIYRALFYLPALLGSSVAIAIVWQILFQLDGPINTALAVFGVEPRAWASNPGTVLGVIVALAVWQLGTPMVIFIAGLKQIPTELYEAAEIDGAGTLRRFFSVTLPLLTPVIFFNLVVEMIGAFQTFTAAQLIGDGRGGPVDSTLFYSLYLYQRAFQFQEMGYASAMAWIMLIILGGITALMFWSSRKWVHYGE